ncbi:MAG: thioredoxin [Thermoguttaceae bacterium]
MSVVELTDMNFSEVVLQSKIPVLVDFWSPTCGPCRALFPVLSELSSENESFSLIAKVNIFESPETAAKYGISTLPTLLFFKEGQVVERMVGVQPKDKLQETLEELEDE